MIKLYYVVMESVLEDEIIYDFEHLPCWGISVFNVPVRIEVNGELRDYAANTAVVYAPGQKCKILSSNHYYSEDWIRFECDEPYMTDAFLPFGIPFTITNPYNIKDLFRLIAYENIAGFQSREMSINQLMTVLLNKLHEFAVQQPISPLIQELIKLHDDIYLNPGKKWTVPNMANEHNLSVGYLHTAYKEFYGISCMNDVINSRIQHAKQLLEYSSYSIKEMADICGYNNSEHFSRQFSKIVGVSLIEYRRNCKKR
ncbi:MAG: DNA-binding protein, AraC-type [Firmicutes bacterium]|nr:DNA-binding protein, AraC-type [Bacillota bacterium]